VHLLDLSVELVDVGTALQFVEQTLDTVGALVWIVGLGEE
jgi:hypothetical protein